VSATAIDEGVAVRTGTNTDVFSFPDHNNDHRDYLPTLEFNVTTIKYNLISTNHKSSAVIGRYPRVLPKTSHADVLEDIHHDQREQSD
jgi:hypothetical protein